MHRSHGVSVQENGGFPLLPISVYGPAFGALCGVIVWQSKIILSKLKREEERSDSLAKMLNSFIIVPNGDDKP